MVENPARKDYDVTKATGVLERCGVVVTERKRGSVTLVSFLNHAWPS